MWSIYEINHISTAVVDESEEWSSQQLISNLDNWKGEAWKHQCFNGIRTRDLRDTGAMLYQLSYEATHWERVQFIEFIQLLSSSSTNAVEIWIISYILRIISLLTGDMNSINWPLTMYSFIAQLVEHRTGIAKRSWDVNTVTNTIRKPWTRFQEEWYVITPYPDKEACFQ